MEGKLLIAQLAVLLQDAAAKYLLSCHALPAGVVTFGLDEVPIDKIQNTRSGIDDLRDLFELPGNRVARNGGKKVRLAVQFSAHVNSQFCLVFHDIKYL